MLETIKQCIWNIPDISFNQFYIRYILAVQDTNINNEFKYMIDHNTLDIGMMDNVIQSTYEGLMNIC